jgi:hypothetical protein
VRVLAFVAAVLVTSTAAANPSPIGKRLFDEGRVLYDTGKYVEACVLFEKSYELDPAPGTKLNLAECAEREGKPRVAWLLWVAAGDEFEQASDSLRAKFARERADHLAPQLSTIVVDLSKAKREGLVVKIGDREVPPADRIVERVEPGKVTIAATAPELEPFATVVDARLGGEQEVVVVLKPPGISPPAPAPKPTRKPRRWIWAAIGIASIPLFVLSVRGNYYTKERNFEIEGTLREENPPEGSDRRNELVDQGRLNQWLSRGTVAGAALCVAGLTVSVVQLIRTRPSADRSRVAVTPVIGPGGTGATLSVRW